MALGIPVKAYSEEKGAITGKKLRIASLQEVEKFNDDLVNIAAMFGMDSIRSAIEEYQEEIWVVVRQVMEEANAPYGGSGALGDEVCMRAIRPIDLNFLDAAAASNDTWVRDNTAVAVGTTGSRQITYFTRTMNESEGALIFGALIEEGSRRVINAYRWSKNQKDYPTLTLPFTYCDQDRAPFVKFQAPIAVFTEETLVFRVNVVQAVFSYMAIVGIYTTRASQIAATNTTGA